MKNKKFANIFGKYECKSNTAILQHPATSTQPILTNNNHVTLTALQHRLTLLIQSHFNSVLLTRHTSIHWLQMSCPSCQPSILYCPKWYLVWHTDKEAYFLQLAHILVKNISVAGVALQLRCCFRNLLYSIQFHVFNTGWKQFSQIAVASILCVPSPNLRELFSAWVGTHVTERPSANWGNANAIATQLAEDWETQHSDSWASQFSLDSLPRSLLVSDLPTCFYDSFLLMAWKVEEAADFVFVQLIGQEPVYMTNATQTMLDGTK
jgi:hypothetical protein